jgi:hypothetical protein
MRDLLVKTHTIGSPSNLIVLDAISGKTLRTIPTHGTMFWSMDRPWLRELFSLGIEDDMHLSKAFQSYGLLDDSMMRVTFADGTPNIGRMLVVANGIPFTSAL